VVVGGGGGWALLLLTLRSQDLISLSVCPERRALAPNLANKYSHCSQLRSIARVIHVTGAGNWCWILVNSSKI
jgi:hypothetical protein